MNLIKKIEIKNFKSIRHQTIDDCKRINVFIGYPNVGKSNILEALSLISYLSNYNQTSLKSLCRFKELIDVFNDGDKQKDAEIFADDYVFALRFIDKNQIDFGIVEKENYVEKFNNVTSRLFKNIRIDRDGKTNTLYADAFNDKLLVLKKYEFRPEHDSSKDNPTKLSFPFGSNLAEIVRYNSLLRKECGELFSAYNLKLVFDENENIIIQKQLDEFSAFQFSFSQVADTLQRLIFHKAAIATNEHTVLLFEEPEAHMFPPYISKFTADVMYDKNDNQFFITTHSPFVINDFMENLKNDELSIYVVGYKKETGETLIRKLTDEELHEIYQYGIDLYFNLENYLMHEQQ
jgi:AAA15 family ATPase/GTPase